MKKFSFGYEVYDADGELARSVEVVDCEVVTLSDVAELFVDFMRAVGYQLDGVDLVIEQSNDEANQGDEVYAED